jgi:AcrR family transcriptional regulator
MLPGIVKIIPKGIILHIATKSGRNMSKAERTKSLIIEKTAPVFNTKGYAGTSIADISEATGLTKGSIYGNFSNKDEVALAVFDFNFGKVKDILKWEMSRYTSAKDQLLVYARVYDNYLNYPFPEGGCPVLNTSTEADDTHPALRKKAIGALLSWKKHVIGLIEKGIKDKEFRKGINAEQTALAIIAMIEGGIMISKVTGSSHYRKSIMNSVEKLIEDLSV